MFELESLNCPISKKPITDPVIAADGHTYELMTICDYLNSSKPSPMTKLSFTHNRIMRNLSISDVIKEIENKRHTATSAEGDAKLVEAMDSFNFFEEKQLTSAVPELLSLLCPLTKQLFAEPVLAGDGYTYEKAALQEHLSTNGSSPHTGKSFPHKQFMPNWTMQRIVDEYKKLQQQAQAREVMLTNPEDAVFFHDAESTKKPAVSPVNTIPPAVLAELAKKQQQPTQVYLSTEKVREFTLIQNEQEKRTFLQEHTKTIALQKRVITEKISKKTIDDLSVYLTKIENIELDQIVLGVVGARVLSSALTTRETYLNIKVFNLIACHIGPDGMVIMSSALSHMPQLEHLLLDQNEIGDRGACKLAETLSALTILQGLSIQQNGIGTEGTIALILAGHTRKQQGRKTVFQLNISNNPFDKDAVGAKLEELKAQENSVSTLTRE